MAGTVREPSSVSALAVVGTDSVSDFYGGFDIYGYMPVSNWLSASAAAQLLSTGTYSLSALCSPGLSVGGGRIFLDATVLYRALTESAVSELGFALLAGYERQYFSLRVGVCSKTVYDTGNVRDSFREPFDFLYKLAFKIRPSESRWNLGASLANYTPYEFERTWLPMFFIFGNIDLTGRLSVLCEASLKPAGMMNMQTTFGGFSFRTGICFNF